MVGADHLPHGQFDRFLFKLHSVTVSLPKAGWLVCLRSNWKIKKQTQSEATVKGKISSFFKYADQPVLNQWPCHIQSQGRQFLQVTLLLPIWVLQSLCETMKFLDGVLSSTPSSDSKRAGYSQLLSGAWAGFLTVIVWSDTYISWIDIFNIMCEYV